jgi:hypothetical protein
MKRACSRNGEIASMLRLGVEAYRLIGLVKFQQRYQMRHRKSRDEDALWGFNSPISSF